VFICFVFACFSEKKYIFIKFFLVDEKKEYICFKELMKRDYKTKRCFTIFWLKKPYKIT